MRQIEYTTRFRRDFKREMRGRYRAALENDLPGIVTLLRNDSALPARLEDHALTGNLADHRDCHVKPDLVLIYRKPVPDILQLVRLGTHSELGI